MADASLQAALRGMGVQADGRSGDSFRKFVADEVQRAGQLVRSAAIRLE